MRERNRKEEVRCNIKVINIQGLTKTKAKEVEEMVQENSLVGLTETQRKVSNINFGKDLSNINCICH